MGVLKGKKVISYISEKLAGAGFLIFAMFTYVLITSGMEMYEVSEVISNWGLWAIVFGYGILCSLLIDLMTYKFPKLNIGKILLYIIAGYAFFIVRPSPYWWIELTAGTVGGFCALIFYFGTTAALKSSVIKLFFALVIPITILVLVNADHTAKALWSETRGENSYTATFNYFNGKHEIPIRLTAGQTITYSYNFINSNGGGHGFHVLDKNNNYVGVTEINNIEYRFNAEETGIYRFVVTGDDVKGKFTLNWGIE